MSLHAVCFLLLLLSRDPLLHYRPRNCASLTVLRHILSAFSALSSSEETLIWTAVLVVTFESLAVHRKKIATALIFQFFTTVLH